MPNQGVGRDRLVESPAMEDLSVSLCGFKIAIILRSNKVRQSRNIEPAALIFDK